MTAWIINLIPAPYRLMAFFILLGAVFVAGGYSGWTTRGWLADAEQTAVENGWLKTSNINLQRALKAEQQVRDAEQAERDRAQKLEIETHEAAKKTHQLLSDNRRLARELGGLRDPYATRAQCEQADAAADTVADAYRAAAGKFPEEDAGFLSAEASDFILDLAADADEAANYARTCHEWAKGLSLQP